MRLKVRRADVAKAKQKASPIAKAARSAMVVAARRDTESLVPRVSGALRSTAHYQSDPEKGELVYGDGNVTYARPQYYGCPDKTLPGTTSEWFEHAKPAYMPIWLREGQEAAKEAARNG